MSSVRLWGQASRGGVLDQAATIVLIERLEQLEKTVVYLDVIVVVFVVDSLLLL